MPTATPHMPQVVWAQRRDKLFVTIELDDCSDTDIQIDETSLHFKARGGSDKQQYDFKIDFYEKIDPKNSKYAVLSRNVPMMLMKANEGDFWPRLLKEKLKVKWLQTDWNKWKDEDESDHEGGGEEPGLEDMMSRMGGFGGGMGGMGGMPGMGGMGGMPGMGGMGGMPGMGGMGGPGFDDMGGALDDEEFDSDDEELPDLEKAPPANADIPVNGEAPAADLPMKGAATTGAASGIEAVE